MRNSPDLDCSSTRRSVARLRGGAHAARQERVRSGGALWQLYRPAAPYVVRHAHCADVATPQRACSLCAVRRAAAARCSAPHARAVRGAHAQRSLSVTAACGRCGGARAAQPAARDDHRPPLRVRRLAALQQRQRRPADRDGATRLDALRWLCDAAADACCRCSTTCRSTCSTWRSGRSISCSRRRRAARARATVRCALRMLRPRSRSSPALRAVMGKAEGKGENWHGHVTAVTVRRCTRVAAAALRSHSCGTQVAPEYRRQGLAQKLMGILEEITIKRRVPAPCVRCSSACRWLKRPACTLRAPAGCCCAGMTATSWTCSCASPTRSPSACMRRREAQARSVLVVLAHAPCLRSLATPCTGRSSATTPARRTRTVRARRGCR
jgi:hypothetical protein